LEPVFGSNPGPSCFCFFGLQCFFLPVIKDRMVS